MMTPRPGASGGNERKALTEEELQERARKKQDRSAYYIRLQQQKQLREKSLQYNDRAAQRRRKEREDKKINGSSNGNASGTAGEVDTTNMSVEETKLLGGDIEHTHLVKGLDYALLEKRKMEIEMENARSAQALAEEAKRGKNRDGEGGEIDDERGDYQPISDLAKRIYKMFSSEADASDGREDDCTSAARCPSVFTKNRVVYRYKFDEDDTTPVPVTVLMDRSDASGGHSSRSDESGFEAADAMANKLILSKIGSIMKLRDKLKKRGKQDEESFPDKGDAAAMEDLEIFAGAGKLDLPMLDKRDENDGYDGDTLMIPSNGSFVPMKASGYLSGIATATAGKRGQREENEDEMKGASETRENGDGGSRYVDVTEEEYHRIMKLHSKKASSSRRNVASNSSGISGQKQSYGIDPAMKRYFSKGNDGDEASRARPKTDFTMGIGGDEVVDEYAAYYPGDDEISFAQIKNKM